MPVGGKVCLNRIADDLPLLKVVIGRHALVSVHQSHPPVSTSLTCFHPLNAFSVSSPEVPEDIYTMLMEITAFTSTRYELKPMARVEMNAQ